ncbi:MAG: hypothetical protein KC635_25050 [Myxococcales bacterium]|nr:hypothetical protein [Myxococcales bacterium]MCB9736501.1 hypothetical protein [Deltaproteobacteria bacterium]
MKPGEIEVRVHGAGVVNGDAVKIDEATEGLCSVCGGEADAVASLSPGTFACADCLRARLDAVSVARWRLKANPQGGLPWGKLTS